jgi:hypothetical protein
VTGTAALAKGLVGVNDAKALRRILRDAGLSKKAIEAAWPSWWSDAAETSPSARAELRFAVARSLGLSPRSLVGERVEFVWRDRARFKHLEAGIGDTERAALNSFGTALGRALLRATREGRGLRGVSSQELRQALLKGGGADLASLVSACWATGIPVAYLFVSPLQRKAMHAMVVGHRGRQAILLSRKASYPALVAFTLAHEIGHIALGHVPGDDMLVDAEEPGANGLSDAEEEAANRYALEVLIGDAEPDIRINLDGFNSAELADAVLRAAPVYGIEPGTLALAVAKRWGVWPVAMTAMKFIYGGPAQVPHFINDFAARELDFDQLDADGADFVRRVLGIEHA